MGDSIQWGELPVSVREAIEERTGPVTGSLLGGAGFRTGMRLILHTETGDVFVKGIGPDGGDIERGDLDLGAELAPFVPASPSLSFKGQADGWVFTGWQAVEGRQASMKPGSDDIPLMIGLLAELGEIEAPDVPGLRTAGKDWGGEAPTLSGGHMLVHTDPHGGNFVVQPDRTWMIDLGHAVRGPGWLTSARFILYLMRAGWTAAEAEAVVMDVPAWARADPEQVTAHAIAGAETWYRANNQYPVPQVWRDIIREWAEHRTLSA
jgi:hypothetical protein